MEGNILVDGVLASCYASADHGVAHFGMIPIRWFPKMIGWIFGEENEFSAFVKIADDLGGWMPYGLLYERSNMRA